MLFGLLAILGLSAVATPPPACPAPQALGSPPIVEAFLDPVASSTRRTYLELRRLVSERPGETGVVFHWLSGPSVGSPAEHRTRVWLAAMDAHGATEAALALLEREGPERLAVRLQTAASRAEVAAELGIPSDVHARVWNSPCADLAVRTHRRAALDALEEPDHTFRAPRFRLGGGPPFEDTPDLDNLRTRLGAPVEGEASPAEDAMNPAYTRASSERLRRPELRGALLGGPGLAHQLLVTARSEDDAILSMLLPPVLAFRRDRPGRLSIQIVARGAGLHADRLRHRLCASMRRDLLVPYVRWLAEDPALRRTGPAERAMLKSLDAVPARECPAEPDPADLGLPEGGWLDGVPRSRTDLETLPMDFFLLDAAVRPLTPWLPTAADGM